MHANQGRTRETVSTRSFRRLPLAAAVAMVMFAPQAWAQDAAQEGKDKEARTLDAVTVTAQKR